MNYSQTLKVAIVTGVSGLIGYEVAQNLLKNTDFKVIGVARTNPEIKHERFHFLEIDFEELNWIEFLPHKADYIFHLAQSYDYRDFPDKSQSIFTINTDSTLKLLNYGIKAGIEKFTYISSGGVAKPSEKLIEAKSEIETGPHLNFYLRTKFISEILVKTYQEFFKILICRPFFVYGKRQQANLLFPRLAKSIKEGNKITIQGKNGITINPIYVADAAEAIVKLFKNDNIELANVGGTVQISLSELVNKISTTIKGKPILEWQNSVDSKFVADIDLMNKELGTAYQFTSITEGLKLSFE